MTVSLLDTRPDDVLAALLAPGGAVVALVGPDDAAKSALLNQLGDQLGPAYHVVRLSGRADLNDVLAGFELPTPERDEAAGAAELLEQFRAALQQRTTAARAACEAAAASGERPPGDERAVAETHGDGLVALLDGPTKDALFRDTPRRKSVFRALVRGEPAEFAAADFEFADVNSARLADPKAQRYVAKLKTNLQGERAAAAALMNAARTALPPPAAPPHPLALVRDQLARAGHELVILYDDYAGGLLEQLAATGVPFRVALATTDDIVPPGATVFALPPPEPVVIAAESMEVVVVESAPEVNATLGALAVLLGRLPVPAPDDVIRLLAAAHTTGATLDLFTPAALDWLRAHDLPIVFRVR